MNGKRSTPGTGLANGASKSWRKPARGDIVRGTLTTIGALLSLTSSAFAASAPSVSQTPVGPVAPPAAAEKPLSLHLELQTMSSFQELDSADHAAGMNLGIEPSIALGPQYKLTALIYLKKDLENERELATTNTKLALTHAPMAMNPYLSFVPAVTGTIPSDKIAIQGDSFRGAAGATGKIILDLSRAGMNGLNLSYKLGFTQNFYEFETSFLGASNSARSLSNTFRVDYAPGDRWSFNFTYVRGVGFTYNGGHKNNFEISPSVAYSFTQAVALEVGLDTLGEAYKENGSDSRVSVFDPNSTSFYASLQFTL